jgi:predicted RNA-binding protein with RPS1 domain
MKRIIGIALLFLILPISSFSASIKLSTGDDINAEIIEHTDLYIKAKHDILGELTILKSKILSIDAETHLMI